MIQCPYFSTISKGPALYPATHTTQTLIDPTLPSTYTHILPLRHSTAQTPVKPTSLTHTHNRHNTIAPLTPFRPALLPPTRSYYYSDTSVNQCYTKTSNSLCSINIQPKVNCSRPRKIYQIRPKGTHSPLSSCAEPRLLP